MSYADFPFSTTPYASEPIENALIQVTSVTASFALQGAGVEAGGTVSVVAAETEMNFGIGSVIAEAQSIVSTTGVQADTNLGTAVVAASAPVSVTGEELTSELGTATAAAGARGLPTSLLISPAIGTETVTGTAVITPTGEEIVSSLGTAVAAADASVSVTGLAMQFADGTPTVTANAVVEPTGLSITFSEGTATAPAAVILTGIEMSSFVGNMRSTPWANVVTGASNTWTEVAA